MLSLIRSARRMNPSALPAFLGLLALGCSNPTIVAAQARPRQVQSVDVRVPVPPRPVRVSGRWHLAYELHITNFQPIDVALTRIEVREADRMGLLGDFTDSALVGRLGRPGAGSQVADKRVIAGGMLAVVYLWLPLDAAAPPARLTHRIELDLIRPAGREHEVIELGGLSLAEANPVVLDPPLRGGPWVAVYDPMLVRGHRTTIYTIDGAARIPGRFAIDWILLDSNATVARGDRSRVANWHGYGAPVLAVADAVVADAKDDMAEDPSLPSGPPASIALEAASGNYVTLDLGGGRYAFYEHLKSGSVRVRGGDRVTRGQVIGQLGNSGSSSAGPHLHFHVSDTRAHLEAEGLPFVLRNFEVIGRFETIGAFAQGQPWKAAPAGTGGSRRMELPGPNTVLIFDGK